TPGGRSFRGGGATIQGAQDSAIDVHPRRPVEYRSAMRLRSLPAALLLLAACSGPTSPSPSAFSSVAPSATPAPTPTATPAPTPPPPVVVLGQVARVMVADLQVRDQPPNFAASQPIATLGQ